jgi:hypothetical protein
MSDELSHIFIDEKIRYVDYGYFVKLEILGIGDLDEYKQVKNSILIDHKIAEHVMNCKVCRNEGLFYCKELEHLKGVYS